VESFDHVIVGAGSAGCVLARRLSDDPTVRVCLLEAGGSDASPVIRMPAAFSLPMNSRRYDWGWHTEPEPGLDGRRLHCPRGRVLGGSSSINGMVWVRGHPLDFEQWAALGADGWGWADVAPYFRRAEDFVPTGEAAADARRGRGGPLGVRQGRRDNPLHGAFLGAAAECGYAVVDDLNGPRQEAFGPLDASIVDGVRCSAWRAYVRPVRHRSNLEVRTGALAREIVVEDGRARAVRLADGTRIEARRSVISAAGAIASPLLLMRSGIGDPAVLADAGIAPRHALAGVGANLMDHLEVYVQQACTRPVSLNAMLGLLGRARIGARWLLRRDGPGATNHFETGAFLRSAAGVRWPDLQIHFLPAAVRYDGRAPAAGHGFQAHIGPMRPASRGRVRPSGPSVADAPSIRFDYLAEAEDRSVFRRALRLTRELFAAPALAAFAGEELAPGAGAVSDDALDAFVRTSAESAYHPCGTCRMGTDAGAVVDPDLRVRGIEGLHVADASVFPSIPNGNLNAPTIMLAERAADLIAGRAPLAPEPLPYWTDPAWETRQRPS
jgi:choline dehydrogenase